MSCHEKSSHSEYDLLPMYALSLKDVVENNSSLYQQSKSYKMDDELVQNIKKEVEMEIQMLSN